ncbi:hypothetical protein CLCR_03671 [Cladophialophora carrionii]|uniref:Uncharacterized protein n=1 Tax=Cladophialophora carrionii TaxID=86049 RepID=A0A1C1CG06_9EURO|nr:hypothetical protein CLCR_03671 [Cladophialophora carrionii]
MEGRGSSGPTGGPEDPSQGRPSPRNLYAVTTESVRRHHGICTPSPRNLYAELSARLSREAKTSSRTKIGRVPHHVPLLGDDLPSLTVEENLGPHRPRNPSRPYTWTVYQPPSTEVYRDNPTQMGKKASMTGPVHDPWWARTPSWICRPVICGPVVSFCRSALDVMSCQWAANPCRLTDDDNSNNNNNW